jgi:alpha/beta superfamily hydrolase
MQLLMRRPEITSFVSVSPPANQYDFTFLAPCPSSGLVIHGGDDKVVPEPSVAKLIAKLTNQRDITIDYRIVPGTDHFFHDRQDDLTTHLDDYLAKTMGQTTKKAAAR